MAGSQFRTIGFRQFRDRILMHGLEWLGLYYSTYRAVVVDRRPDDNTQGKITVRVPAVDGPTSTVERIAYPIAPVAGGSGFGLKSLPPDDGFVYVEFENGRLDIPLWKGGWWRTDELPEDLEDADAHGWFTPGGHQILLSDVSGSEALRIRHSVGAEVVIDKDGNIAITNSSGKTVTVGADDNEEGVLGATWKDLTEQILDAIGAITVPTGMGPSGIPINKAQFDTIKGRLQTALSQTVKIAK